MLKFNLNKFAKSTEVKNYNAMLKDNVDEKGIAIDVVDKNINFSLPKKEEVGQPLLEKRLDASRNTNDGLSITEKSLENSPKMFNNKRMDSWDTDILPINLESQKYDQRKAEALKKAENKNSVQKETEMWDKYLGVQHEGEKTKVNLETFKSQLQNNPDRFDKIKDGEKAKYDEMVTASLKDADSMLFHIYATAASENRELTKQDKQTIMDINSGKIRLLTIAHSPVSGEVFIAKSANGVVVKENGTIIDTFGDIGEAKANYPEATIL